MTEFHTVKEAALLTGKSSSSIRRIIYPIIAAEQHPDREHVQPSVNEVRALRLKGASFAWRISDELLRRAVPAESLAEKGNEKPAGHRSHEADADLLAVLRGEIEIKNQQIAQQSAMLSQQIELISGLSDRLGEGNILIATLQQQLALPEGTQRADSQVVDANSGTAAEKGSATHDGDAAPKKGFFAKLFA